LLAGPCRLNQKKKACKRFCDLLLSARSPVLFTQDLHPRGWESGWATGILPLKSLSWFLRNVCDQRRPNHCPVDCLSSDPSKVTSLPCLFFHALQHPLRSCRLVFEAWSPPMLIRFQIGIRTDGHTPKPPERLPLFPFPLFLLLLRPSSFFFFFFSPSWPSSIRFLNPLTCVVCNIDPLAAWTLVLTTCGQLRDLIPWGVNVPFFRPRTFPPSFFQGFAPTAVDHLPVQHLFGSSEPCNLPPPFPFCP